MTWLKYCRVLLKLIIHQRQKIDWLEGAVDELIKMMTAHLEEHRQQTNPSLREDNEKL
jgi:hypothetical protein